MCFVQSFSARTEAARIQPIELEEELRFFGVS
jgi:hypothetical protein